MKVGNRCQSYHRSRCCIPRHGGGSKRAANAEEKVEKTRVRREGKRAAAERTGEA
jgi:hypothetical protein